MADSALAFRADEAPAHASRWLVTSAVEGLDARFLARHAARADVGHLLHVARDGPRASLLAELAGFFAPDLEVLTIPAWDCLPYDRVSPNTDVMARRLDALAVFCSAAAPGAPGW